MNDVSLSQFADPYLITKVVAGIRPDAGRHTLLSCGNQPLLTGYLAS